MIPLLGCAAASRHEAAIAAAWALPEGILMERAALSMWRALQGLFAERGRRGSLVALVGPGNNGGDALALLRQAAFAGYEGALVALLARDKLSGLPALQLESLRAGGRAAGSRAPDSRAVGGDKIRILSWAEEEAACRAAIAEAGWLLDGLFGTGLAGPLRGEALAILAAAQESPAPGVSLDVPSGLHDAFSPSQPIFRADYCLSVEPRKLPLYYPAARPKAGRLIPLEGVFPAESRFSALGSAWLLEEGDLPELLPPLAPEAFKTSRGRVGLLAGEAGTWSAAALASSGAFASGAGYVRCYLEDLPRARGGASGDLSGGASGLDSGGARDSSGGADGCGPWASPEASLLFGPAVLEPAAWFEASLGSHEVLLLGPGWRLGGPAKDKPRAALLARLLASDAPLVLDAGALRLLPSLPPAEPGPPAPRILCPHPGELSALVGLPVEELLADPRPALEACARRFGACCLFKSHVTWIASPEGGLALVDGMEPSLGTAGSGDLLAGLAAGFLARELAALLREPRAKSRRPAELGELAFKAARAAVLVHRGAGARLFARRGFYRAGELAEPAAALAAGMLA